MISSESYTCFIWRRPINGVIDDNICMKYSDNDHDSMTASFPTNGYNESTKMISAFNIKQGGVYSIKCKLTKLCQCRYSYWRDEHIKLGMVGHKDVDEFKKNNEVPLGVSCMKYNIKNWGWWWCYQLSLDNNPTIEMIIDFQNPIVIICAMYIQDQFQMLKVMEAREEELYFPFIGINCYNPNCDQSCNGVKLQFFH